VNQSRVLANLHVSSQQCPAYTLAVGTWHDPPRLWTVENGGVPSLLPTMYLVQYQRLFFVKGTNIAPLIFMSLSLLASSKPGQSPYKKVLFTGLACIGDYHQYLSGYPTLVTDRTA
jgi:hypothetical protein